MKRFLAFAVCLLLPYAHASALFSGDWFGSGQGSMEDITYTIYDQDTNTQLASIARRVSVDDQYISGDNKLYRVTSVQDSAKEARAVFVEDVTLPSEDWDVWGAADDETAVSAAAGDEGKRPVIALYCTHTDESYVPTDGTESEDNGGGILDVAKKLAANLEEKGYTVAFDDTNHVPHDAGAYKRSRRTAIRLIKAEMPAAVFDIHRDAVPVKEYEVDLDGTAASKVRIVVGRQNPNQDVNEELAYRVKAVADQVYPGLIKDIFIGKGAYNQELSPRSLLFEFGTHELDKERVLQSTGYIADVVSRIFPLGGAVADQGAAQNNQPQVEQAGQKQPVSQAPSGQKTNQTQPKNEKANPSKGAGSGIIWIVGIVAIGAIVLLIISTGSQEWKAKLKGFGREFGDLKGKK